MLLKPVRVGAARAVQKAQTVRAEGVGSSNPRDERASRDKLKAAASKNCRYQTEISLVKSGNSFIYEYDWETLEIGTLESEFALINYLSYRMKAKYKTESA